MKVKFLIPAAIGCLTIISSAALSQNRSLQDENRRIREGVRYGQLTEGETVRLKAQESKLKTEALRFKANDGRIGPVERTKLRGDEKRLDRNICRQKHDAQRRH